jgi:trehalose 6-phosphate phosphatase
MAIPDDALRLMEPLLADPAGSAILLDLDGTLAPIVEHPEDVRIPGYLCDLLPVLAARYGLLAFISGRALNGLRGIVGLRGVAYSGNHGLEIRLPDGQRLPSPDAAGPRASLREFARRWAPRDLAADGIWLEDKGSTLTFHYRTARDPARAMAALDDAIAPAARDAGLVAAPGRMSLEIHPSASITKGTAARRILAAHPEVFHVVSVGDDRTDVEVWRALRELVAVGRLITGIGVGVESDESPAIVLEEADVLVPSVAGVGALLAVLADVPSDAASVRGSCTSPGG